ncbi:MAG: hypothetical protein HC828_19715 [Blastochloris sp.]|nr:hypothetical protein [Blastochloris sp.]
MYGGNYNANCTPNTNCFDDLPTGDGNGNGATGDLIAVDDGASGDTVFGDNRSGTAGGETDAIFADPGDSVRQ